MADVPRTNAFISYSHQDVRWLKRLQVHLKPLEREGLTDRWDDTRIKTGADWQEEIRQALASARVAVLLISADFLASDFIAQEELPPLLAAAEAKGVRILPVNIAPSLVAETPLGRFQAVNPPDRPLSALSKNMAEAVLVQVAKAVQDAMAESRDGERETDKELDRNRNVPVGVNSRKGKNRTLRQPHTSGRYGQLGCSPFLSGWGTPQAGVRHSV